MKLRISKWVRFTSLCFVFLMLIGLNSLQAKAGGDTFTITFRAGNLGNIDSATYYKVEAMVGDSLMDILNDNDILNKITVKSPEEYYVEPYTLWKMNSEAIGTRTVDKDCDIVISYGRLIDSAEYMVKYLDIDTGVQVAKPFIARGENNYDLTIAPLSGIVNYELISPTTAQTIILDNTKLNEVIFYYRSTLKGTVTENFSYETLPDETVTTTETVDTIVYNPVTVIGGGGGNAQGNATEIEDEGVALEDTVDQPALDEDALEQEDADNVAEEEQMIEDEEVALSSGTQTDNMLPIITGVICFVGLAAMIGVYVIYRRKTLNVSEEPEQPIDEHKDDSK